MIYADLAKYYLKFHGYPFDKMSTSVPLIQSMYTYMNRVKRNVAEFTERIQDWVDIKENSQDPLTDNVKDMTVSEKSDMEPAPEHVSNQAQDSSVQIVNEEPEPKDKPEEIKDPRQPGPGAEPIPAMSAESGDARQLGEKRYRPAAERTEIGADIALLFEARDTMKRAKKEYDEARQAIEDLFEPIK